MLFSFLGFFSPYLWALLSLKHFRLLWVNTSCVLSFWLFSPLLFSLGWDVLISLQGVLCFTHTDYICSVFSWLLSFPCATKTNWKTTKKKKKAKKKQKQQQQKWAYLLPSRLILSVAHGERLAAFLVRTVVTCPSASQGTWDEQQRNKEERKTKILFSGTLWKDFWKSICN